MAPILMLTDHAEVSREIIGTIVPVCTDALKALVRHAAVDATGAR
jgi:hypothetical protein